MNKSEEFSQTSSWKSWRTDSRWVVCPFYQARCKLCYETGERQNSPIVLTLNAVTRLFDEFITHDEQNSDQFLSSPQKTTITISHWNRPEDEDFKSNKDGMQKVKKVETNTRKTIFLEKRQDLALFFAHGFQTIILITLKIAAHLTTSFWIDIHLSHKHSLSIRNSLIVAFSKNKRFLQEHWTYHTLLRLGYNATRLGCKRHEGFSNTRSSKVEDSLD